MMTETLMVRCRDCGSPFAVPDQFDRATLEALVLTVTYRCPRCGTNSTYVKADHFHRLEVGPIDPDDEA
jgi:DNA-directed RNA polymerase subunit RPC12/RpoP